MSARPVLVVEDDAYIAHILEFMLAREGFAATVVRDGEAALRALDGAPPALVLLDVMLPLHDGYAVLAQIRAREAWRAVPVIMLTARSQEADIVRALEAGATDYVVKPFLPREVMARIKRHVPAVAVAR